MIELILTFFALENLYHEYQQLLLLQQRIEILLYVLYVLSILSILAGVFEVVEWMWRRRKVQELQRKKEIQELERKKEIQDLRRRIEKLRRNLQRR